MQFKKKWIWKRKTSETEKKKKKEGIWNCEKENINFRTVLQLMDLQTQVLVTGSFFYLYNKTRHHIYVAYSRPNDWTDWAEICCGHSLVASGCNRPLPLQLPLPLPLPLPFLNASYLTNFGLNNSPPSTLIIIIFSSSVLATALDPLKHYTV